MLTNPSRRNSRFGIARGAGRSSVAAAEQGAVADTTVSASQSEVTASPSSIANNGTETSTITVTLRNAAGTPLSGKAVTLSSTGTNNTLVQPGTTDGNGQATGTIATTTAEAKTVTAVAEGVTVTDTAVVTAAAAPALVFAQEWATTGETTAILQANGSTYPFDLYGGSKGRIVTAASLGLTNWPTDNCFQNRISGTGIPTQVCRVEIGAPTNGLVRSFRIYYQMNYADSHGNGTTASHEHGFELNDALLAGGSGIQLSRIPRSDGTWFMGYRDLSDPAVPRYYCDALSFDKDKTYRIEYRNTYATSTYTIEIRITDESTGTVVATADDFLNAGSPLSGYTATYAAADHAVFGVGSNGPTSNFPMELLVDNDPLQVHGAVAICETGAWCGAYTAGEGA